MDCSQLVTVKIDTKSSHLFGSGPLRIPIALVDQIKSKHTKCLVMIVDRDLLAHLSTLSNPNRDVVDSPSNRGK